MRTVDMMADIIRCQTNSYESDFNYYIDRLREEEGGYSPECLCMIRMERDAKTLRAMADKLDAERSRLTAREIHLEAAE